MRNEVVRKQEKNISNSIKLLKIWTNDSVRWQQFINSQWILENY